MEIKGFYYDNTQDAIRAYGAPIPQSLTEKGYTQKNDRNGVPAWYVVPCKVKVCIKNDDGKQKNYDIYSNIMALYPERKQISLKLAHEVWAKILTGDIILELREDQPYLTVKPKKVKKATKKT